LPTPKLVRPGFGPAAELPAFFANVTASRPLQVASRFIETPRRQRPRRFGFGTWALATQLSVRTTVREIKLHHLRGD
jgi:hypothetical protein